MNVSSFSHPPTHTRCIAAPIFILYICLLLHSSLFLSVTQPAIPSVPPRFLTSGSWDVTLLCTLDEKAGKMYVRATVCAAGLNHPLSSYTFIGSQLLTMNVQVTRGESRIVASIKMIISCCKLRANSRCVSCWRANGQILGIVHII